MNTIQDEDGSFRDSVAHIDESGHRVFFYPKKPSGRFYKARTLVSFAFLVVFFTIPFLKIDGDPLFLFNVVERKFIIFGVRFWPQDFFIFMIGMITFIVFIALFTVVYGRIFCGWVCPQTVFMEMIFRKIEYAIDGDANYQKALKKMPWNAEKIRKRVTKWIVFFIVAFVVSNVFLSYIIGMDELYKIMTEPLSQHVGGLALMIIFSLVFFFVYLWFREQACLVVCPYGRMQGVLLDKHSIVVAYDHVRGEPRHKPTKEEIQGVGDCVDCNECYRVCPTGIDIRNGTQLECTNCTACIDACDNVMDKIHKPRGLVRYASEFTIQSGKKLRWTPRMFAYTGVLFVLIGLESFLLITRSDLDVAVVRAKGTLFYTEPDGSISNLYNVKVINKTKGDMPLQFIAQAEGSTIRLIGNQDLVVKKDSLIDTQFFVIVPANNILQQKTKMKVEVWSNGKKITEAKTTFLGPAHKN
ncbi:MAG: cytochrome c oxidase accessory protein CcoG [Flavobacteriales bacterium]|nr:cytochrome c oxidase accessory protein CcoG [Flavobacteriales bacterium]